MMSSKQALTVVLKALAHYPNAVEANMAGKWAQSLEAKCQELQKTNRRLQANNDLLREKLLAKGVNAND